MDRCIKYFLAVRIKGDWYNCLLTAVCLLPVSSEGGRDYRFSQHGGCTSIDFISLAFANNGFIAVYLASTNSINTFQLHFPSAVRWGLRELFDCTVGIASETWETYSSIFNWWRTGETNAGWKYKTLTHLSGSCLVSGLKVNHHSSAGRIYKIEAAIENHVKAELRCLL